MGFLVDKGLELKTPALSLLEGQMILPFIIESVNLNLTYITYKF